MELLHALATGIWGGLLALERRAFLQAMVARPLVAATVTGLLHDDILSGLLVGVVFELLHLGGASLGGAHPENELLPAVVGAALASGAAPVVHAHAAPAVLALSVLLAAPLGRLGLRLEHRLDERARRYYGRALTAVDAGKLSGVARQNLRALWPQFVLAALAAGTAAGLAPLVGEGFLHLPPALVRGLAWAWPALGAVAAGVAVQGTRSPLRFPVAALATIAVAAALLWTHAQGGP